MYKIAIHPDTYGPNDNSDRYAPYWIEYLESQNCKIKIVNASDSDIINQVRECDGFMWRWFHGGHDALVARRLFKVLENYLHIPCFPNISTAWHYDDKVAQKYIFEACNIPHPKTWFFTSRDAALDWANTEAAFPVVLKLSEGAGSSGVTLVNNKKECLKWIKLLFSRGISSLEKKSIFYHIKNSILYPIYALCDGWANHLLENSNIIHNGYILFQEFLPNNKWDTRVVVVGNRAFAFRRFNRENDFRASGSGKIDYSINNIDLDFIRLAFKIADCLKTQSIAIDGLWREKEAVVCEISYAYVHNTVYKSPGHWSYDNCLDSKLIWNEGHMWPGTSQAIDFLNFIKLYKDKNNL